MRKNSKVLALLLALTLVLSLAACKKSEPKDAAPVELREGIVGTWYTETDLLNKVYGGMAEYASEEDSVDARWIGLVFSRIADMPVGIHVTFDEAGGFTLKIEESSLRAITEAGRKLWPEMLAIERDMPVDDLEKDLAEEGLTMEDLIEMERGDLEEFTDFTTLAGLFDDMPKLRYAVSSDKLTLVFSEAEPEEDPGFQPVLTVSCTASTLTVTATDSEDADAIFKGLVLTREN